MGKADLHIHTAFGDGLPEPQALLEYVESCTDLDVIAITEHDTIDAALRVRELHARGRYRFEVVVGMEITTLAGHLLALFVEEPVPSLRPLTTTIDRIHSQGGLCVVPHPLSPLTRSLGRQAIEGILRRQADGLWFDGIELSNPSPAARFTNGRAQRLNFERWKITEVGSSDAHYLPAIGCTATEFPGRTAADLRAAILAGTVRTLPGRYPSLSEIGPRAVMLQSWRALWATPRHAVARPAMAVLRRLAERRRR